MCNILKDGITHFVFLSCSFAIRDIFLFAHYGFLQVRQVCARRKLAHPRIVASLQCRVCSRLSLQSNGTVNRLSHFSVYIRQDGITRISPILPCVLFPYISGFIASAFIRLVRFAVLRQTCAPSHCRFAPMPCMFPSFAPIERGLTMQSPFNWSEIDGITHIIFLSCSFAIRDIFFFAHYGSLQVRQVCARRKLAHPRIVASLQCRVRHVFRSKQQKQRN